MKLQSFLLPISTLIVLLFSALQAGSAQASDTKWKQVSTYVNSGRFGNGERVRSYIGENTIERKNDLIMFDAATTFEAQYARYMGNCKTQRIALMASGTFQSPNAPLLNVKARPHSSWANTGNWNKADGWRLSRLQDACAMPPGNLVSSSSWTWSSLRKKVGGELGKSSIYSSYYPANFSNGQVVFTRLATKGISYAVLQEGEKIKGVGTPNEINLFANVLTPNKRDIFPSTKNLDGIDKLYNSEKAIKIFLQYPSGGRADLKKVSENADKGVTTAKLSRSASSSKCFLWLGFRRQFL